MNWIDYCLVFLAMAPIVATIVLAMFLATNGRSAMGRPTISPVFFYTGKFLLFGLWALLAVVSVHPEWRSFVPYLIQEAYKYNNAPRYLLVKGPTDFIVDDGKIVYTVSEPNIPVLEPIGGTGDTITGILSALIGCGFEPIKACLIAAKANRLAGQLANPTPATRVAEIINYIGRAVRQVLNTL